MALRRLRSSVLLAGRTLRERPLRAMRSTKNTAEAPVEDAGEARLRPCDLAIGGVVGVGALLLYAVTLCPTIYVEDSAEFSTAAAIFGIPHPPGYPLYSLLAGLFVRVLPVGDVGFRSNMFSAVCGAGTVAALWILLRRLGASRLAALAATLCFGLGTTFWSQCLAAEVHALNGLLIAITLLCVFGAARAPVARKFALAGLMIGLTIGHRNLNLLLLAPLFFVLVRASRNTERRLHLLGCAAAAMAVSALIYVYLPLAARRDPALDMGAPVTLSRFYDVISTHTYFRHLGAASVATDARRFLGFAVGLPSNLGIALIAAPFGFVAWWQHGDLVRLATIAWMVVSSFVFAAFYNVVDVESYLIPAYLALAIAAGVGFDAWHGKWRVVLPIAALLGIPMVFSSVNLRHTSIARDYGRQLLESGPPQAIIVSFGDTETHVLTYEQAVDHRRPDIIVVSASEIDEWYVEQLSHRHPEVAWPAASPAEGWLAELAGSLHASRPICLTQPVNLGLGASRLVPTGLLFCLAPRIDERALDRSVVFWRTAVTPSAAELQHPEVHVQMIDFAFALSRFMFAEALSEAGNVTEACVQLRAVVAASPDVSEGAIVASMKTIGREHHQDLALGQRAEQALRLDPHDPRFLTLLRL
ncbi:MAG TPA: DUF2723 domain-containing protein [Polyangia bacterium]